MRSHLLRGRLLRDLCSLDYAFDVFLLLLPLLIVGPPCWSFVFALQAQVLACSTLTLAFIALLPSKSACEATCKHGISLAP